MNPTIVRIPKSVYQRQHNDIMCNLHTLKTLREAGIPVEGVVTIKTVLGGSLSIRTDHMNGDTVFTYTPDNPNQPAQKRNFDDEDDDL